jgi:integrase
MGNQDPAATWQVRSGTCQVQPGHRQQAPGLRPGQIESQGCRPWRPYFQKGNGHAAKDAATGTIEVTEQTRNAVAEWIRQAKLKSEDFLFPSRIHGSPHITTRQYARIVEKWVASIGLDPADYGTHSFRRTKASLIYRRTKNIRAVQLLLGHTKLESTVRYLGIEVDDALEMAEQTEV